MRGSALGPHSLLLGPFPGEPGFAPREIGENLPLPSSSLTLGTLSNCTKVAVVPVLPPHQGGVCFQSFLSHGLHSRPRQSPCSLYSWIAQLCMCVFGGGGGLWLEWVW